jgi:CubicO group peptidase (beta-lactamase class C family)
VSGLSRFLEAERAAGSFPSAVGLVGDDGAVLDIAAVGARNDTRFDLASLTKVLSTAPLAALAARGGLEWERPIGHYLPDFRRTRFEGLRVWHLAAHVSGLPAWRPLYASGFGPDAYRRALAALEPEAAPGARVLYSDLGILIFGEILEEVLSEPLDRAFAREIAVPAGSAARFGPIEDPEDVAPTERGNQHERLMCEALGVRFAGFRTETIRGEAHDANAHFRGGVAAHAGLFGAAEDVWRLARQWLAGPEEFLRDWTPESPESRGLFWQRKRGAGSAIEAFSEASVGHTGFTGTSVWIEPDRRRIFVLLSNRVHPEVRDTDFNAVRRRFHEAVARDE